MHRRCGLVHGGCRWIKQVQAKGAHASERCGLADQHSLQLCAPLFSGQKSWYSSPRRLYASRTPPARVEGATLVVSCVPRILFDMACVLVSGKTHSLLSVAPHAGEHLARCTLPFLLHPTRCLLTREQQHCLLVLQQAVHVLG